VVGDLAVESWRPATGNLVRAARAAAIGGQAIIFDEVAVAADERFGALRAARVFVIADSARKISCIDVAQACLVADFGGAQKIFCRRIALAVTLHFVVGVEGSDVPGNFGRDTGDEFAEAAEFVVGIVEAGDEQRDDLKPQTQRVNAADAVEDGSDASAELVIVAVVEAFEIDFVEIDPGAQVLENLRSGVAVGDESGDEAGGFGLFEDGDRPLAGDERLVIGADNDLRALIERIVDQGFRRDFERGRDGAGIAQGLRGDPILAVSAVEIATEHAEAVGERAGISVEERLFFDGIALHAGSVSPGDVERAASVEADFADAGLAFGDGAAVTAGEAANAVVVEIFDEGGIGLADALVEDGAQSGHRDLCGYFSAGTSGAKTERGVASAIPFSTKAKEAQHAAQNAAAETGGKAHAEGGLATSPAGHGESERDHRASGG
jgi:hypothetical protein